MSLNWLQQQRSTPSFASAVGVTDQLNTALDRPMPAALRDFGGADSLRASQQHQGGFAVSGPMSPMAGGDASFRTEGSSVSRRARTPPASFDRSARARSAGSSMYTSRVLDERGASRQIDVFESLVERGKLSAEAKDRARIDAEQDKMRRCRSVPKINKTNDDYSEPSSLPIFKRLWNKAREKQVRDENKWKIMKIKEDQHYATLFQPRISSKGHRSKGSSGTATSTERFSFKTVQRMEELRKEKVMKEMEMMMDTPDINPKSKQMAQRQREREGMAGYSHIEAMLERDRLSKLARYEQRERELIAQTPGTPRITEYAASLHRSGGESANERLYRSAGQRARTPPASAGRGDQSQSMHVSSIYSATPGPSGPGRGDPQAFSNLARHEAEARARRDERVRKIVEAEASTYTPSINPVSASIASRLPTSTSDRLAATTPRRSATTILSSTAEVKPLGPADAPPSSRDVQLFERLRIAEARRKMRVEAARHELEQRRDEECTFTPVTTTSYYPPSRRQGGDLYERSQQWQQSRDERIQQQKDINEAVAGSDYTFQPAVSRRTQEIYEAGGYAVDQRDPARDGVAGFDQFVSRAQRAKQASAGDDPQASLVNARPWNASTALSAVEGDAPERPPVAYTPGRKPASTSGVLSTRRPVDPPSATALSGGGEAFDYDYASGPTLAEDARSIRSHVYQGGGGMGSIYDRR